MARSSTGTIELPESWLDDDPTYDPYAVFDEIMGAGAGSPYPVFARLRERSPVVAIQNDLMRGPQPVEEPGPDHREYGAYGYDAVMEVLRDPSRFSSAGNPQGEGGMEQVFGHSILNMDPPEHSKHRSLVAQAFRPKVLQRWEEELLRPMVTEQVDSFASRGEVDLTKEFTLVYPVKVIAGILGVPLEHWDWYRRRAVEIISLSANIDRGLEAVRALREYFTQIIELRRRDPGQDLISELVQAEVDGHTLSDEEILPFLMLLSPAGAETTYRSTGNLLYGLFTNPDQFEAVKQDRSLLPQAIEEAIRWEPPLTGIQRTCTVDTEVEGVEIPAWSSIAVSVGSANRDESVWGPDADQFDLYREHRQHMAFAFGPHMCLGMHLARLEMKLAVNHLLDRLPDIDLVPDTADDTYIDGIVFRAPNQLQVRFTPN